MPSVTNNSATITPVRVAHTYRFVVGVDTHAATHSYAILDAGGALLDEQTFPTTTVGIGRAREWIGRRTAGDLDGVLVAAEGTGSYGAVLAEALAEVGYRVVEAPTPRRERGRGKTDAMDAVTAARNTLTMPIARLRDRRGGQDQVALQVLTTAREQLNAERLRGINALTALVRVHDLGIDARRALTSTQVRQIASWRRRHEPLGVATARAEAVRLAGRVVQLDAELKSNREQLTAIVTDRAPELLGDAGCRCRHRGRCAVRVVPPRPGPQRGRDGPDRRHMPDTSVIGQHGATPAQSRRRPTTELGAEHRRADPDAHRPHHPRLRRSTHRRGQDQQGDPTLPQALHHPPDLPHPQRRAPTRGTPCGCLTDIEASRDVRRPGLLTQPIGSSRFFAA